MTPTHRKFGDGCSYWKTITLAFVVPVLLAASPLLLHADGVFVFKWNKQIDINEPTQKAIIVHDAGREDLLLQVKYEGPLEEFGWLIPVPAVPKVEKGSMEAFYELSELTQLRFGSWNSVRTLGGHGKGLDGEDVQVIEIKTVGAYEVAVLSARDAGSLERWLRANDYSIPEGKSEIVDEYIRKGWYFVAARIQLNNDVAFKTVTTYSPKDTEGPERARKGLQQKISSGELHPLLISFDTPTCVFPLKISSVNSKPSAISLYVLSAEALLSPFLFDEALGKIERDRAETERLKPQREKNRLQSMQNMRSLSLAYQMYTFDVDRGTSGQRTRDWTVEDLEAIGKEGQPTVTQALPGNDEYYSPTQLLECMSVSPDQIPQSVKSVPRLKGREWYLTKYTRTFHPDEMRDLEFQPAIPVLARTLSQPSGAKAAGMLSQLGTNAVAVLISACRSANTNERIHASAGLQSVRDPRVAELLPTLFKDEIPQVRYYAVSAAAPNWDARLTEPLIALFRDPYPQIAVQASQWLTLHESSNRAPVYVELLRDRDPTVQNCALRVLQRMNRQMIPRGELLRLLGSPQLATVSLALNLLQQEDSPVRPEVLPGSPWFTSRTQKNWLSSTEAAPLTTNSLTMARLMGLKILNHNADAEAVTLSLPLLSDTNSIVRSRAFTFLRTVSGQDFPQNDRAKWELWWSVNRGTFHPRTDSDQKPF